MTKLETNMLCKRCKSIFKCKTISRKCEIKKECYCGTCYIAMDHIYKVDTYEYNKFFLTWYYKKDLKTIELFKVAYTL